MGYVQRVYGADGHTDIGKIQKHRTIAAAENPPHLKGSLYVYLITSTHEKLYDCTSLCFIKLRIIVTKIQHSET